MLISGASSGIGRATALAWAKQGGNVVPASGSTAVLEEVAPACSQAGKPWSFRLVVFSEITAPRFSCIGKQCQPIRNP